MKLTIYPTSWRGLIILKRRRTSRLIQRSKEGHLLLKKLLCSVNHQRRMVDAAVVRIRLTCEDITYSVDLTRNILVELTTNCAAYVCHFVMNFSRVSRSSETAFLPSPNLTVQHEMMAKRVSRM